MPIRQLSQSLINRIAAGEVIERPASVVKELMENAVDAGATRIDVAVQQGGLELVRVVDNGSGITAEELPLAVASHATSKLAEEDDLFRVGTLGFRGEALASIAEISRLVIRSRTAESAGGAEIEVTGGRPGDIGPCGCPVGTTVEVHNLFFNTPVRRKFLRSPPTEFGHVSEAFTRIALAAPRIHFTLRHNERPVYELAASDGLPQRIALFFGRELAENLIWVEGSDGQVVLSGYVAHPSQSRSHNRMQYLFLNGRHIRDRALQHALGEAYRGLLLTGRYPIAFLSLQMPPEMVDVNVHPTKLEVRFQDSGRLYSQLLATIRNKFLATDLSTRVQSALQSGETMGISAAASQDFENSSSGDATVPMLSGSGDPGGVHDPAQAAQLRQQLVDWAKGKMSTWQTSATAAREPSGQSPFDVGHPQISSQPLELRRLDRPWIRPQRTNEGEPDQQPSQSDENVESAQTAPVGRGVPALQIHNRYLVAESEEGVMVIDQHALHERILYEALRERMERGAMEMQSLLVPEAIDLSAAEASAAMENKELLAELGVAIEPFGGGTVLLTGFPAMLANIQPVEMVRDLLERLLQGGKRPERRELLDDLLHTIACKAAIKAGDRLSPAEIASLLEQRHLVADSHHCPHGRPAALVFTREELDKQFKRG
jgi:DNA mismatch repair protein MutL